MFHLLQALLEYWASLPVDHREALFAMREEDFSAELDAQMRWAAPSRTYILWVL